MIRIGTNSGRVSYGIKDFVLDEEKDLEDLKNKPNIYPNSTAFIIENSKTYMKNSKNEWVEVYIGSGGGSNSKDDPEDENGIYDGGNIDSSDPTIDDVYSSLSSKVEEIEQNMVKKDGSGATGTWDINISGVVETKTLDAAADLDETTEAGTYAVASAASITNKPEQVTTESVVLLVIKTTETDVRQILVTDKDIYLRDFVTDSWNEWTIIEHKGA